MAAGTTSSIARPATSWCSGARIACAGDHGHPARRASSVAGLCDGRSAMTSLRWGLLSTARINRALIPAIRAGARSELVAVASREADRATEYARQWDIPQAFGSYEAMLADPSINVIYISLPNHLHVEWTIKAVLAGKHVLC